MPTAMGRLAFWFSLRPHRPRASRDSVDVFARADSSWMKLGRKRVAVYRWGTGNSVLLVHGWSSRAAQMRAFVTPLEAAGFRVVAFDAPAHGRSTGSRTDFWEIAETLNRLEQEQGPFEGIITHSVGALASAIAMASGALQVQRAACLAPALKESVFIDGFVRVAGLPERVAAKFAAQVQATTEAGFWDQVLIPVPTLLIHDSADEFISMADVRTFEEQWPAAQLMETNGLGHSGILTDPQVVLTAVEFLAGQRAEQHAPGSSDLHSAACDRRVQDVRRTNTC